MAIINEKTGFYGFTIDGLDGTIDSDGKVDRIVFAINYPLRSKDVEFLVSTGANDWGAQMGDDTIIPLSSPKVLFQNRDNSIVQFTMSKKYPSNSPALLVYRSDSASFSVNEIESTRPFSMNSFTGHFGFTVEGYHGTTDSEGKVNRMIITIPFPAQRVDVTFTISDDPSHWGARMPNGEVISLRNPSVMFTNTDNAVVVFEMDKFYPSNSPCVLVYRSSAASITIKAEYESVFIPVSDIQNVPSSMNVGETFDLLNARVEPINASVQDVAWRVASGYATLSGTRITPTASGAIILVATISGGKGEFMNFTKSFTIQANAAPISITSQPEYYTTVRYGAITETLSVRASIAMGSLSYQWFSNDKPQNVNGTELVGRTGSTLQIPAGLEPGTHYFYCEVSGSGGASKVTSNIATVYVAVRVTGVAINPKPSSLAQTTQKELTAIVYPDNADNKTLTWTSSNPAIATVDSNGVVTGIGSGSVTITVRSNDGGYTDTCTLNVATFIPVTNIKNVANKAIIGEVLSLATAVVEPSNASSKQITWSIVSDFGTEAILDVDTLLIPQNLGEYEMLIIRASIADGIAGGVTYNQDFRIAVEYPFVPVTSIAIAKNYAKAEEQLFINARAVPSNATNQVIIWSIAADGGTGSAIDETGLNLTATNPGVVTLCGRIINGASATRDFTQYIDITISEKQIPVSDITDVITDVEVNEETELGGTVVPEGATYKDIEWKISGTNRIGATLSADGKFLAPRTGTVTATAVIAKGTFEGSDLVAEDNSVDYTKNFTINVINFIRVQNITGVPGTIGIANNFPLSGIVEPENATNQTITWSLVNAGSTGATLSAGKLTTKFPGNVTVKATIKNGLKIRSSGFGGMFGGSESSDYTQEFTIAVREAITGVTNIDGIPEAFSVGDYELQPNITPEDATNQTVVWSVVDGGTVSNIRITGNVIHGESTGTARIKATIINGIDFGNDYTKEFTVTFNVPDVPIKTITKVDESENGVVTVDKTEASPGDTVTFSATPLGDYKIGSVKVFYPKADGSGDEEIEFQTLTENRFSFVMPDEHIRIKVEFVPNPPYRIELNSELGDSYTVTVDPEAEARAGDTVRVTAESISKAGMMLANRCFVYAKDDTERTTTVAEVTYETEGKYMPAHFTMPAMDVTIVVKEVSEVIA